MFIHDNADGGKYVKIGYHEGLVSSETWLRVQDKKAHNVSFSTNRKAFNSWLVGLMKCADCGYAVMIDIQVKKNSGRSYKYLIDNGWTTHRGCISRSYKLRIDEVEQKVYEEMCKRIERLEIAKKEKETPDTETESIKADILRLDDEIRSLMDRMAQADDVVFAYIQQRIKELYSKKSELERKLQTKVCRHKAIDTKPLADPLTRWEELSVQDKHDIAAELIEVIYISHNSNEINIHFAV